jgi:hypothetical protein
MAIVKTKATNILCLCSSIVCNKYKKGEKKIEFIKNHEKKEEKKKANVNLILSHVNHTFFILDPQIEPHTFQHTNFTLEKNVFL